MKNTLKAAVFLLATGFSPNANAQNTNAQNVDVTIGEAIITQGGYEAGERIIQMQELVIRSGREEIGEILQFPLRDESDYDWVMKYVEKSGCQELGVGNTPSEDGYEFTGFLDVDCSEGIPMCFEDDSNELIC